MSVDSSSSEYIGTAPSERLSKKSGRGIAVPSQCIAVIKSSIQSDARFIFLHLLYSSLFPVFKYICDAFTG